MSDSQLISLLVKQIEDFYRVRSEVEYQLEQATMQKQDISERILALEKALYSIDPTFDLRRIQTQFNPNKLSKQKRFHHDVSYLIAKVLKEYQDWCGLYTITAGAMRLDEQTAITPTRGHQSAIAGALRRLTKLGVIEMRKAEPHKSTKKRVFSRSHEWRIKPL